MLNLSIKTDNVSLLSLAELSYSEIHFKLLQRGTGYLYSTPFPTTPTRIISKSPVRCASFEYHLLTIKEKQYGKALMKP